MTHKTPTGPLVPSTSTLYKPYKHTPKPFVRREALARAQRFDKAPDMNNPMIMELLKMHTYCRPSGSVTERDFCAKYIDSIPGVVTDAGDNRIIHVGDTVANPVLWSSHTDTVHHKAGTQKVTYGDGILTLSEGSLSSCLGADCTVGVWIMRQMILANVPGVYIFHSAEEIGGHGSRHIANATPDLIRGLKYAIAFDRKGTHSIITHQMSRCASDEFGSALAEALGSPYSLDTGGTFTDTANYTKIIPECTNISVGYYNQHFSDEYLDVSFALHVLNQVLRLDVSTLPAVRDPSVASQWGDDFGWGGYGGFKRYNDGLGSAHPDHSSKSGKKPYAVDPHATLEDLVWDNPEVAALMLEGAGFTADDFRECLAEYNFK